MDSPHVDEHVFTQGLDMDSDEREILNGRTRFIRNGRTGTSDTNKVGVIESIRGNKSYGAIITGETVIGSCADVRNNAVLYFVHNNTIRPITYSSASVTNVGPVQVSINNPSEVIPVGSRLRITQGASVYVGRVNAVVFSFYLFTTISNIRYK